VNYTNEIANAVAAAAECKFLLVDVSRTKVTFARGANEKLIFVAGSERDSWAYETTASTKSSDPDSYISAGVKIENLTLSLAKSYGTGEMRILGTGTTIERAISVALDQVSALYERLNGR
jgi:hypothetical protein